MNLLNGSSTIWDIKLDVNGEQDFKPLIQYYKGFEIGKVKSQGLMTIVSRIAQN